MLKLLCLIFFIICLVRDDQVIFAETLPPLPIEELKRIELVYLDTLIKPVKFDSFCLKVFGGNIFGGQIKYSQLIGKKTLVKLQSLGQINRDYSSYLYKNSNLNVGWLTKSCWQEWSLSSLFKKRQDRKYNDFAFTYRPVRFFNNRGLFFNTQMRIFEYDDVAKNRFMQSKFNVSFGQPTTIGIINIKTNNSFHTDIDDIENYYWSSSVGLANLMTVTSNFYIQPKLNYIFFYQNNKAGEKIFNFQTNLGFGTGDFITTIDFGYNNLAPTGFDTLYVNLFPYLVNKDLIFKTQITEILLNWTFKLRPISFGGRYQKFASVLNWRQQDCWFVPEITDNGYTQISVNFSTNWSFFTNDFVVNYFHHRQNLMPVYTIIDTLRIKLANWQLLTGINLIGERDWYYRNLPAQMVLMMRLSFQYRIAKFFVKADNLLNRKYEILPAKFDQGYKFCLGFELNK